MEVLNKRILIIIFTIILFSCKSRKKDNHSNITQSWKKDSLGCMNLRNKNYSDKINKKINFIAKSEKYLIKKLGKYNKVIINDKYKFYLYYYGTSCQNNKIIDSVDYCYLEYRVNIKTKTIVDYQNVCR